MEVLEKVHPVQFTPEAVAELQRLMAEEHIPEGHMLRVGVKGGGCSGLSYVLGFDAPQEGDERFEVSGVPIVMNKSHALYLYGMQINFQSGLNARGFVFQNPNAKSTCGCGTSFSA